MRHIKAFTIPQQMKRPYKSFIAMVIVLLFLPAAALTEGAEENLLIGMQSYMTTGIYPLDPVEKDMASVYSLVYNGLIEMDDDFRPQGKLAESWVMGSGGERWTFTLREGVTFSDGTPLTAYDAEATLSYLVDKANNGTTDSERGYYGNLRYFVKSVKADDEKTLTITTKDRANYAFLYAMTFPILPADRIEQENPPGTGPYIIDGFVPQSSLYLSVNPNWWKQPPQIKYITCTLYSSNKDLLLAYENMAVDAVFSKSISAAQYSDNINSLNIAYRTNQLETLLINNRASEFKDPQVRKALRHVINVNQIASQIYMSMVQRTDTPLPAGTWMYNEDGLVTYEHNIDKAKEMLAEAGWRDSNEDGILDRPDSEKESGMRNFSIRLLVYDEGDNTFRSDMALMIRSMLAEVNINVYDIQYVTFQEAGERLRAGNYDLALVAYQMDTPPDPGFMLISGNTGNHTGYKNTQVDDLFKKLRKATDPNEYQQILFDIQHKFSEDVPFISLFYRSGSILTRNLFTIVRDVRELELFRGIDEYRFEPGQQR